VGFQSSTTTRLTLSNGDDSTVAEVVGGVLQVTTTQGQQAATLIATESTDASAFAEALVALVATMS
jgi:hypothetical protein